MHSMQWNSGRGGQGSAAGITLLIAGIATLVVAVALMLTLGTVWAPILLGASVLLNTAAVMLLRKKK